MQGFENIHAVSKDTNLKELVIISKANIGQASSDEIVLHDINLMIRRNTITMVIGPVGC
jgi:ABC-type phosphate transport system ATPase subunit